MRILSVAVLSLAGCFGDLLTVPDLAISSPADDGLIVFDARSEDASSDDSSPSESRDSNDVAFDAFADQTAPKPADLTASWSEDGTRIVTDFSVPPGNDGSICAPALRPDMSSRAREGTVQITYGAVSGDVGMVAISQPTGDIWVTDPNRAVVYQFKQSNITTINIDSPAVAIAVDSAGSPWVGAFQSQAMIHLASNGIRNRYDVSTHPAGIAVGALDANSAGMGGNSVWIAGTSPSTVRHYTSTVTYLSDTMLPNSEPNAIAVDPTGGVWVSSTKTGEVIHLAADGHVLGVWLLGMGAAPVGVAVDCAGNAWFADRARNMIVEVSPTGTMTTYQDMQTFGVTNLTFDGVGNLWATDPTTDSLTRIQTGGGYPTSYSYSMGSKPFGIAMALGGYLAVTLSGSHQVIAVQP